VTLKKDFLPYFYATIKVIHAGGAAPVVEFEPWVQTPVPPKIPKILVRMF
jgi:hypothetical protein